MKVKLSIVLIGLVTLLCPATLLAEAKQQPEGGSKKATTVTSLTELRKQKKPPKVTNLKELRKQRKQIADRERRVIFNNDGSDVRRCQEPTEEAFLGEIIQTGLYADTIFYNMVIGLGLCRYDTKVGGEPFLTNEKPFDTNLTKEFLEQGTDGLKMAVNYCKKNNIEIFVSIRMNDTHDGSPRYGHLLMPKWKKDHPELALGVLGKKQKYGRHTAMDYEHQEVRDMAFNICQELCQNYDVDGIELDFLRHFFFFKPFAMGKDCGNKERDLMTGLVRRVRKMTEKVGLERGRPMLLAVRVPDSVELSEAAGLDITRWMEEGLIDILISSGYWRFNPWEESAKLGQKYDIPVYACIPESRFIDREARKLRNTMEAYRGRVMNVWNSGVDGVYLFNFFSRPHNLFSDWSAFRDPEALKTLDKVFTTGGRTYAVKDIKKRFSRPERFINRQPFCSSRQPLVLAPNKSKTIKLQIGQEVEKDEAKGLVPNVTLRLKIKDLDKAEDVQVKLNGAQLTGGKKVEGPQNIKETAKYYSYDWLEFTVDPSILKKGNNRFRLTLKPRSATQPVITDLRLWVRYRKEGQETGEGGKSQEAKVKG